MSSAPAKLIWAITLFFVSNSYYQVQSLNTFIAQVSQYKPEIFEGNALVLMLLLALTSQLIFIFSFFKQIILKQNYAKI